MGNLCSQGARPGSPELRPQPLALEPRQPAAAEEEAVPLPNLSPSTTPCQSWLTELGLSQYVTAFEAAGYDTFDVLGCLEEKDLDTIELFGNTTLLPGHRKKILLASKQMGVPARATKVMRSSSSNGNGSFPGLHTNRVSPVHVPGLFPEALTPRSGRSMVSSVAQERRGSYGSVQGARHPLIDKFPLDHSINSQDWTPASRGCSNTSKAAGARNTSFEILGATPLAARRVSNVCYSPAGSAPPSPQISGRVTGNSGRGVPPGVDHGVGGISSDTGWPTLANKPSIAMSERSTGNSMLVPASPSQSRKCWGAPAVPPPLGSLSPQPPAAAQGWMGEKREGSHEAQLKLARPSSHEVPGQAGALQHSQSGRRPGQISGPFVRGRSNPGDNQPQGSAGHGPSQAKAWGVEGSSGSTRSPSGSSQSLPGGAPTGTDAGKPRRRWEAQAGAAVVDGSSRLAPRPPTPPTPGAPRGPASSRALAQRIVDRPSSAPAPPAPSVMSRPATGPAGLGGPPASSHVSSPSMRRSASGRSYVPVTTPEHAPMPYFPPELAMQPGLLHSPQASSRQSGLQSPQLSKQQRPSSAQSTHSGGLSRLGSAAEAVVVAALEAALQGAGTYAGKLAIPGVHNVPGIMRPTGEVSSSMLPTTQEASGEGRDEVRDGLASGSSASGHLPGVPSPSYKDAGWLDARSRSGALRRTESWRAAADSSAHSLHRPQSLRNVGTEHSYNMAGVMLASSGSEIVSGAAASSGVPAGALAAGSSAGSHVQPQQHLYQAVSASSNLWLGRGSAAGEASGSLHSPGLAQMLRGGYAASQPLPLVPAPSLSSARSNGNNLFVGGNTPSTDLPRMAGGGSVPGTRGVGETMVLELETYPDSFEAGSGGKLESLGIMSTQQGSQMFATLALGMANSGLFSQGKPISSGTFGMASSRVSLGGAAGAGTGSPSMMLLGGRISEGQASEAMLLQLTAPEPASPTVASKPGMPNAAQGSALLQHPSCSWVTDERSKPDLARSEGNAPSPQQAAAAALTVASPAKDGAVLASQVHAILTSLRTTTSGMPSRDQSEADLQLPNLHLAMLSNSSSMAPSSNRSNPNLQLLQSGAGAGGASSRLSYSGSQGPPGLSGLFRATSFGSSKAAGAGAGGVAAAGAAGSGSGSSGVLNRSASLASPADASAQQRSVGLAVAGSSMTGGKLNAPSRLGAVTPERPGSSSLELATQQLLQVGHSPRGYPSGSTGDVDSAANVLAGSGDLGSSGRLMAQMETKRRELEELHNEMVQHLESMGYTGLNDHGGIGANSKGGGGVRAGLHALQSVAQKLGFLTTRGQQSPGQGGKARAPAGGSKGSKAAPSFDCILDPTSALAEVESRIQRTLNELASLTAEAMAAGEASLQQPAWPHSPSPSSASPATAAPMLGGALAAAGSSPPAQSAALLAAVGSSGPQPSLPSAANSSASGVGPTQPPLPLLHDTSALLPELHAQVLSVLNARKKKQATPVTIVTPFVAEQDAPPAEKARTGLGHVTGAHNSRGPASASAVGQMGEQRELQNELAFIDSNIQQRLARLSHEVARKR